MATLTIFERVEALTGLSISGSSVPNRDQVDQFMRDGQSDVFGRVVDLSPEEAELFLNSGEQIVNGTGLDLEESRVLQITRFDGTIHRSCDRIPANIKDIVQDSTSLSYRSKYNPVYYVVSERVFILPNPTAEEPGIVYHRVGDDSNSTDSADFNRIPKKYVRHVLLYTAYNSLIAKLAKKMSEYPSVPAAVTIDTVPSFDVALPDIPAIPTMISSAAFDTPSFTYNFAALGRVFEGSTKTLTGTPPIINVPVLNVPILAALNSVVLPATPAVPELDGSYNIDFASISKPTYLKPTLSLTSAPGLSEFSISAASPGIPPTPDFGVGNTVTADLTFPTAPTFTAPTIPSTGSLLSTIAAGEVGGNTDADHRDLSKLFDIATDFLLTEEDTELQGGVNSQIQAIISAYQSDVTNVMNEYNANNAKFQQEVAVELNRVQRLDAVAQANNQKDLQVQLQQYQQELAEYNANQAAYTNNINKEVQQYQIDSQFKLQEWQAKVANEFNEYQNAIQQELNDFNRQSAIFQQEIQVAIQNQTFDTQEDQLKLSRYGQEMARYQAEVSTAVQENQQNEISVKFNTWNQEYQNELARYNTTLQGELQKFNEANTVYAAQTQVDMTELGNAQGAFMAQMQQQTQLNTTNEQQELQRQIQEYTHKFQEQTAEFNSNLQRYQAEVQTYQADVNSKLQKHGQELQGYASSLQEIGTEIQKVTLESQERKSEFDGRIGKFTSEYTDLNMRIAMLKDEYDSTFKIRAEAMQKMAAQQQQMAQQGQR